MSYKTYKEVKIDSPWDIVHILKMELKVNPNEHAIFKFKAIISNKERITIKNNLSEEIIKLLISNEIEEKIIFYGYMDDIKLYKQNEFEILEVEASSTTRKLDLKRNSQSFQDTNMTYENLVKKVISKYSDTNVIFAEESEKKTGIPIIQYQETDWKFLKRMASHFNTFLVPEFSSNKSRFWFGMPERKSYILTNYEIYDIGNDYELFKKLSVDNPNITKNNCLYYIITSCDNFEIGDSVEINNRAMKIYSKKGLLKDELWIYTYKLVSEKVLFLKRAYNEKICGMSIIGEVIDTSGQRLKTRLEIDKEQKKDKAYWYDYTPQTGNSMYCMPKIGTNISLYFKDEKEENARVVNCVRNNGPTCSNMSDYNNRAFTTEHKKVMNLLPQQIDFIAGDEENPLKITLDNNVISFSSKKEIFMGADKDISFIAGKNVWMKAAGIVCVAISDGKAEPQNGLITIDAEVNILGVKVNLRGMTEVQLDSVEGPLKRKKVKVGKLIRNILVGVAIACVVAAIAVVALPAVAAAAGVTMSLSGTAIFATVAIGGSIPVAIQAGKDIHNGENSSLGTYARLGFVSSLGTAIALFPGGRFVEKLGVSNKIAQTVIGSGGAGLISALFVGYSDYGLQGRLYVPANDIFNLAINTIGNMLPDVGEAFRIRNAKASEEVAEKITEKMAGQGIKSAIRINTAIDAKAVFTAYGIKFSNANINVLKKAIMNDPKKWIKFVLQDDKVVEEVIGNPKLLEEILENTIPLILANGATNKETLGEWIYGDYMSYSY